MCGGSGRGFDATTGCNGSMPPIAPASSTTRCEPGDTYPERVIRADDDDAGAAGIEEWRT
jgi:hypothetical protein